jgi:hypothetical protein
MSNDGFHHLMGRTEEYHKRNQLPRPSSGRDLNVGPPVHEPGIPSTLYFNHSQILTLYRVFEKSLCKYMPQYRRLLHTKTTADEHNTPALFRQQSVPTLDVSRDHILPVLLGLTLLNNHRGFNNYTVAFRKPCIICVCYIFRGCNVRSCILNTYQTTDSVQLKYPIQSKLAVKQPKSKDNHSLPSGNASLRMLEAILAVPHTSSWYCVEFSAGTQFTLYARFQITQESYKFK